MRSDSLKHRTVLIVEDEEMNRQMLVRLLGTEGYFVETAGDGETALAVLEERPIDLIVLDVQLPGIDGFDVCRRIKQTEKTRLIPIVLVTGHNAREHRIEGMIAGADDFLSKPFDTYELRARVRSLLRVKEYTDQLDSVESIIMSLAETIEARDPYTQGHCQRLAAYATSLGKAIALTIHELSVLHRGAFLHDIGKIGIPDAVLLKRSRLTAAEYDLMKQHTLIGDRLFEKLHSLDSVRPIVRHHHERLDGSGYPDGLCGDDVPLMAQIVSIVDAYDAMTTDRPHHPARSTQYACAELLQEASCGWRDPKLVHAFVGLTGDRRLATVSETGAA